MAEEPHEFRPGTVAHRFGHREGRRHAHRLTGEGAPVQLPPRVAAPHTGGVTFGDDIPLPDGRLLPRSAVSFSASRAGGPGGQHVNTSSTRVEVRVAVEALPLTHREKALVRERLATRIGADGTLRVVASSERSQSLNRAQAEKRLARLVGAAIRTDPARIPTRPSRAARERLRQAKVALSRRKAERRLGPRPDDH